MIVKIINRRVMPLLVVGFLSGIGVVVAAQVGTSIPPVKVVAWGKTMDGMQLGSKLEKKEIPAGEAIVVIAELKNVGTAKRAVAEFGPYQGFDCFVLRDGKECPRTEFGKSLQEMFAGSVKQYTLRPNFSINVQICCNRIYDMSEEGKYSITVIRQVGGTDGKSIVKLKSKPIEVEIVDEIKKKK